MGATGIDTLYCLFITDKSKYSVKFNKSHRFLVQVFEPKMSCYHDSLDY